MSRHALGWLWCGLLVLPFCSVGCKTPLMQVGSTSKPAVEATADVKTNVDGTLSVRVAGKDGKQIQRGDNNKIVEVNCSWMERYGLPAAVGVACWLGGLHMKRPAYMEK